jgi:hypothetical protein
MSLRPSTDRFFRWVIPWGKLKQNILQEWLLDSLGDFFLTEESDWKRSPEFGELAGL